MCLKKLYMTYNNVLEAHEILFRQRTWEIVSHQTTDNLGLEQD